MIIFLRGHTTTSLMRMPISTDVVNSFCVLVHILVPTHYYKLSIFLIPFTTSLCSLNYKFTNIM